MAGHSETRCARAYIERRKNGIGKQHNHKSVAIGCGTEMNSIKGRKRQKKSERWKRKVVQMLRRLFLCHVTPFVCHCSVRVAMISHCVCDYNVKRLILCILSELCSVLCEPFSAFEYWSVPLRTTDKRASYVTCAHHFWLTLPTKQINSYGNCQCRVLTAKLILEHLDLLNGSQYCWNVRRRLLTALRLLGNRRKIDEEKNTHKMGIKILYLNN